MSGAAALFEPRGQAWQPTDQARGPWSPDALHGGPVAALLAREAEAVTTDGAGPFHVARVTVELLGSVALRPLSMTAALVRSGARIQMVRAEASQDGRPVARATALRIRTAPVALPDAALEPAAGVGPVPGPEAGRRVTAPRDRGPGFHTTGAELRFVEGTFADPGPAMVWIRLAVPVVPGEEPSPLQRAVAAADFGNGVGGSLPFGEYLFVNPDLTVHLSRPPVGEWVGLEADMRAEPDGVGLAQSRLRDTRGVIGRSLQSLYVERQ